MAAKLDPWVRIFEVPETKKHSKGYTIYQVKSTVFPRSSPEASTSVVVWRRYSELRRLHKAISELHQKLGITDQLPPFPRATILNRFDADVVETRREAALNLLKFIGQHNSLFTSEPFTKFFENDENANINKKPRSTSKPKNSKGRSKEAEHLASTLGIQGLSSLYSQMSDTDDDFSICSSLDSPVSPVPDAPLFQTENEMECANDPHDVTFTKNGEENIINHLSNVYEDLQKSKQSESSTHNSMLEQNNQMPYSQYDTIKHLQEKSGFKQSSSKNTCDVSWNFMYDNDFKDDVFSADTALPSIAKKERDHSQSERHPSTSSLSSISSQPCCVYENPVHDSPQKAYLAEEVLSSHTSSTQAEKFVPFIPPIDVSRKMSIGGRKNSVPLTPLTPLTQTVLPVLIPKNKVPSPQEVACSQYIFVAAQQISEAQHHEQQKDYKQALTMYREGVGTLLQGVQGDADGSRREAVRRKTAQYLQRAEQLVARLTRKEKKKDQDYIDGIGIEAKDGGELGLQFHASDLQRYRVAGSAGSVIIATDTFNGDTVAIKVLFKSGGGSGEKTIIPQNVPYMVPIIRYHETQSAIYLVLKFISGGKLWSHISKYVKEVCTDPSDMFETTSNNTYAGRRFLLENEDCDGPAADCSSLCETPSLISNVSLLQSHNPPATAGNLLSVPDRMSVGGCSTCSDASSSSCMPEGYLPIYTEYSPTLPSSSSMVVIPPIGNHVTQVTDSVPKSISAEALIMSSECAEENHEIERGHSAADEKKNREGNNDDANVDNASIGSDTLSGVSEDFSCSLPPNVPSLLPDPLPLPEVRITSCQAGIDVIASQEFETSEYEYPDLVKGCSDETEVVCLGEKDQLCDKDKHFQDTERCFENEDRKYVCDVDKRVDAGSPDANLKVVDDEKEDISVTDTSFASITLPTFSWTKKEDSELASLDIEDLIRNSKKLLINVDHTLQQSKSQSIVTFNDSDDSASVDHSELPYDSVSCDQLDKSKGGYRVLKNSTGNLSECVNAKQATSVFDTKTAQLEIDICNKLGDNTNISKCDIGNDVQDSQCKSVGTDMEDRSRNKHESSKCENLKENCCSSSMSRTIEESCVFAKDNEPKERQSPSNMGSNKCSLKDRLTPNYCQEPLENSIGTLLEQYSASHGHDTRPRLPEGIVKVWSSQILSALTSLHQLGVIWGDFNPDNVLLDEGGSILVTYESRWSSVQHNIRGGRGWKMNGMEIGCKWKRYLAPELESPLTYPSVASDWWSVGALMYHMLTGQSLSGAHPSGITSHTEISLPSHLSTEAASLLTQLLCTHPTERLGGGVAGAQEIKDHAFFTGIQWTD